MQASDDTLRERVAKAWPDANAPAFDATWQSAASRQAVARRRYGWFASAAALVAAITVAFNQQMPEQPSYIEVAELLETTYWTAPSDALMPERSFDIYQEMPVIFESTELEGGTLL